MDLFIGFNLEIYFIGYIEFMFSFVSIFYQFCVEILFVKLGIFVSCINIVVIFIIVIIIFFKFKNLKVNSIKLYFVN